MINVHFSEEPETVLSTCETHWHTEGTPGLGVARAGGGEHQPLPPSTKHLRIQLCTFLTSLSACRGKSPLLTGFTGLFALKFGQSVRHSFMG